MGVLKKLRKYTPDKKFKQLVSGIFTSKLMYGAMAWGGVWDIPGVMGDSVNKTSVTKQDVRKLQILQNKVMRLESKCDIYTPTVSLLDKTKSLSVHQMFAMYTLTQTYKVMNTQQPKYHYTRLVRETQVGPETRSERDRLVEFDLSVSKGSYFYQSSQLWAALPSRIKHANKVNIFKKQCKNWTRENILVKP